VWIESRPNVPENVLEQLILSLIVMMHEFGQALLAAASPPALAKNVCKGWMQYTDVTQIPRGPAPIPSSLSLIVTLLIASRIIVTMNTTINTQVVGLIFRR